MPSSPDVAVVVATRDRAGRLGTLLDALRAQTLDPERFEVVVVDDGSSDGTAELLATANGLPLRTMRNERSRGPAVAREAGWRATHAPLIAFTDDDCVPTPEWLEAGLRAAREQPGAIVQGRIEPLPDERHLLGPFARTLSVPEPTATFPTANMLYPRAVLERIGGFDVERFGFGGEDTDLAWRAIAAGAPVTFAPEARVFHAVVPLGPVGKLRVAARWTSTMRTFARHPELRRQQMTHRLFWKGSHYLLVRALLALLVPRRLVLLRNWLAMPYVLHLLERGRIEGGGPLLAPFFLVHDLVELFAVARGAIRYRTPVL